MFVEIPSARKDTHFKESSAIALSTSSSFFPFPFPFSFLADFFAGEGDVAGGGSCDAERISPSFFFFFFDYRRISEMHDVKMQED